MRMRIIGSEISGRGGCWLGGAGGAGGNENGIIADNLRHMLHQYREKLNKTRYQDRRICSNTIFIYKT